ncbi:MAG: OmpA family protein [Gammaproteobacteria bacterium]|nr:OmpA family protein [Gammaproteobacteria bacterium]
MNLIVRIGTGAVVAVLLASGGVPQTASAVEIDDHPLVSRYEGSTPTRRDEEAYQEFKLITGIVPDSLDFESIDLAGRLTRISYENPADRSALEILANYEQAIVGAGGDLLYACRETECGPAFAGSRWGRFNGSIHLPGVGGYLAGRIVSGNEVAYVAVGVAKRRHQVTVVEVEDMETGLVKIDPEALGQELDRLGHVAIPGVFFDTGKATLTPQSVDALEAMAEILNTRPSASVWVVGHTDWKGSFELNASLSDSRAKAVVEALINSHGIDASRLEGHGVGPLAPRAANDAEAGRGVNRRVELVRRP